MNKIIEGNNNMDDKIFTIIPQMGNGYIAEISGTNLNVITQLDIPYDSISKIVNDTSIITLDKENKKLLFHALDGNFIKSIDVPFGIAMNVKINVVYVGGNAMNGEVCYMVDLNSKEQTLKNIELPVPMVGGKAVDDILILGDKMLLIDDIVYPKYTFEYDISIPEEPALVEVFELPRERTYEDIIKGDMNEDWMVYLSSSSSGYTGDAVHISISGKKEITLTIEVGRFNDTKRPYMTYKDIAVIGDKLYVLTDIGLGYYDLNASNFDHADIVFIEHTAVADRIIKIDNKRLLLVGRYGYELLNLDKLHYFNGTIMDKFWSYGSIDLSNRELDAFPKELKNLKELQHLGLSSNYLEKLPVSLKEYKQLRSLNLASSGIKKVPSWIAEFEQLEYLNLSGINIDNPIPFMDSTIKFPKSIKVLDLSSCQISTIPSSVFDLDNLESLNLLGNKIRIIPDEIIKLKKLKTLKMDWENVSKVSNAINELPMETISLYSTYGNGKIPESIYSMTNLRRIEAKDADIKKLSKKLVKLSKLEYLDLSDNYALADLPDNIGELKSLKILKMSSCDLKILPESICELKQLKELDLSYNNLTALPKEIENLEHLKKLNLIGNKLEESQDSNQNPIILSRRKY